MKTIKSVSVVCPYYNEEAIIQEAARIMVQNCEKLLADYCWELILVNDGSTDRSYELLSKALGGDSRVKLLTYKFNKGRGYALKTGIVNATGQIIVTTEVDLSWGDDIVKRIVDKFEDGSDPDVVIASPNLPGGGYRNVPFKRVLVSRVGNKILRALFTKSVTMNTGMTRGYRREVIQTLPTIENEKEFHLEVLLKLYCLKKDIAEIPATLEWKDAKLTKTPGAKRKSSSKTGKLIVSHLNFGVFANPIKYFMFLSMFSLLIGSVFMGAAVVQLLRHGIAIYFGICGFLLILFSLMLFGFGILAQQNNHIMRELWSLHQKDLMLEEMLCHGKGDGPEEPAG